MFLFSHFPEQRGEDEEKEKEEERVVLCPATRLGGKGEEFHPTAVEFVIRLQDETMPANGRENGFSAAKLRRDSVGFQVSLGAYVAFLLGLQVF